MKRRKIRFSYLIPGRRSNAKPESFGRPVEASGKFCESFVSSHYITAPNKKADSIVAVRRVCPKTGSAAGSYAPGLEGEFLCRERLEFQQVARTATRARHVIDVVELTDVHGIVGFRRPRVAVRGARVKRAVR